MKTVAYFSFIMTFLLVVSCKEKQEGIKPVYRSVTEAVYSTVTVQPRHSYNVFPKVSGIIEDLQIEEGDEVKKGDVLVKISNDKSNVNVQNAQLNYEIAQESYNGESAMLLEMEEQIQSAMIRVQNDSISFERQNRLWKQNVGSRQEFDARKLAYDISKNELERLKTVYKRSKKELKRKVEIAKNTLKINKISGDDFNVRSKLDGMVFSVLKEEGESVTPQTNIAIIGSQSDYILSMLIDEVDISKVYEKQKVIVVLDAFPDDTYEAIISKIYPQKDERSLTFTIEADFVTKPERLLKGLSGEANIIISEKENVLSLPNQYISNSNTVQTNDGEKAVKTGLRSLQFTEIVSGIDSSTVVKLLE